MRRELMLSLRPSSCRRWAVLFHRQPAVQAQRLSGHRRGDVWVAVPVAADPGSQAQPGVLTVRPG